MADSLPRLPIELYTSLCSTRGKKVLAELQLKPLPLLARAGFFDGARAALGVNFIEGFGVDHLSSITDNIGFLLNLTGDPTAQAVYLHGIFHCGGRRSFFLWGGRRCRATTEHQR